MIAKIKMGCNTVALKAGTSVEIIYVNGTKLIIGKIYIEVNGERIKIESLVPKG